MAVDEAALGDCVQLIRIQQPILLHAYHHGVAPGGRMAERNKKEEIPGGFFHFQKTITKQYETGYCRKTGMEE